MLPRASACACSSRKMRSVLRSAPASSRPVWSAISMSCSRLFWSSSAILSGAIWRRSPCAAVTGLLPFKLRLIVQPVASLTPAPFARLVAVATVATFVPAPVAPAALAAELAMFGLALAAIVAPPAAILARALVPLGALFAPENAFARRLLSVAAGGVARLRRRGVGPRRGIGCRANRGRLGCRVRVRRSSPGPPRAGCGSRGCRLSGGYRRHINRGIYRFRSQALWLAAAWGPALRHDCGIRVAVVGDVRCGGHGGDQGFSFLQGSLPSVHAGCARGLLCESGDVRGCWPSWPLR